MRSGTVLAAVAAAAALAGCSSASSTATATSALGSASATPTPTTTLIPHWPVTVTPTSTPTSAPVTINGLPERIVSLDPTATEDLYAVGAGSQVVAVDQDSNFPPGVPSADLLGPAQPASAQPASAQPASAQAASAPDIAAIAKDDPSLVIAAADTGGLVQAMGKLGVPVLIEPPATTMADVYDEIEQIGLATGHGPQSDEVVTNMRQVINDAVAQAGTKYRGLTYYYEVSADPYISATSATLIGHIMDMFGLRNIADAARKPGLYPLLQKKYIVTARPQLIFLGDNEQAYGTQTPAVVSARDGWAGIAAVKNNAVFGLNDDIASRWGPRLPQLVQSIALALEGLNLNP
jgi:iron complex transport system substrate-binding protein